MVQRYLLPNTTSGDGIFCVVHMLLLPGKLTQHTKSSAFQLLSSSCVSVQACQGAGCCRQEHKHSLHAACVSKGKACVP